MKLKVITIIVLLSMFVSTKIFAAEIDSSSCQAPYYIPTGCPTPYVPNVSRGYTADFNCQLARITKAGTDAAKCCPNICLEADGSKFTGQETLPTEFSNFNVFGTVIKVNPSNVGTIINILFTTILGIVSLYAIVRGIYVTGVKRPMAVEAEKIAELNKELTNLVIGAIICWGFIIVIQVVSNLLGVGQLNNLDISGGSTGGTVITIK